MRDRASKDTRDPTKRHGEGANGAKAGISGTRDELRAGGFPAVSTPRQQISLATPIIGILSRTEHENASKYKYLR